MSKLTRPPYILSHLADLQGCGHHRIMRPLEVLSRNGACAGRAEMQFFPDNVLRAVKPDVVLFQRQVDESQISTIDRYRSALPDAFFVYEIDDALSAVPDYSWHAPFMTPNIDAQLRRAIARCDVLNVSTDDLAEHMRSVCEPGTRIRVVPNMLGRDDVELATQTREAAKQQSSLPPTTKLRIGWGGGIGHAGDLALLNDAMLELRDEVEWIFLGMDPVVPEGVSKIFAGATPPQQYLLALAAINVDLIVAPLVDNLFNRCKSNLRLLEAAACAYPVIASPVAPYFTKDPPVFALASSTAEWVAEIRRFAKLSPEQRASSGRHMRSWLTGNFLYDDHVEERLGAWLPEHTRPFKASIDGKGVGVDVVRDPAELEAACRGSKAVADVLYIRPGTEFSDVSLKRFLAVAGDVIAPFSNDGGPWGFPAASSFTLLDPSAAASISRVCLDQSDTPLIPLAAVSGPVVLLRRRALAAIGCPDFDSLSPEIALLEWSVAAKSRGLDVGVTPNAFAFVQAPNSATQAEMELASIRIGNRWPRAQNDEAALAAARERLELLFHADHFRALPPANRTDYSLWAEICDTRGPETVKAGLDWLAAQPDALLIELRAYPCVVESPAEWTFFYPDGATLPADVIPLLTAAIQANPDARIIYADHDYRLADGKRVAPDFKPATLDLHMLLSRDYVSQAIAVRKDALPKSTQHNVTAASLYGTVLETLRAYGSTAVRHLPRILASIMPPASPEALALGLETRRTLAEAFAVASGWKVTVSDIQPFPGLRQLSYAPGAADEPPVTIIIPTKDKVELLAPCIATILKMTDYANFRILIVDNGSTRQEMLDYQATLFGNPQVSIVRWPEPYNWSALNNFAVAHIKQYFDEQPDFLVFLNDDTRVMSPCWLREMVGAARVPGVGAVGARLLYPHGTVQHVGVYADRGMTGHIHKGLPGNSPGTNGYALISHEATAVTGACMLVSSALFAELNGFEETLPHNFNDVLFCLELRRLGLVNVVAARAELQHFEGVTRHANGLDIDAQEKILADGKRLLELAPEPDPYWNPNLTAQTFQKGTMIAGMDMNLCNFPASDLPWPKPALQRLLCIGPLSPLADDLHDGAAIFQLEAAGNSIRIANPPMANSGPWDIRDAAAAREAFKLLSVDAVILTALGEAPLQLLSFIRALDIPVVYRPLDAEAACPRGNLRPNGEACDAGYRTGACQACIDSHSSPHGNVIIPAWLAEWQRFFSGDTVTFDSASLTDETFEDALQFVFAPSDEEITA